MSNAHIIRFIPDNYFLHLDIQLEQDMIFCNHPILKTNVMKKSVFFTILFVLFVCYGCASSKSSNAEGGEKNSDELMYEQALAAIAKKDFLFDINRVNSAWSSSERVPDRRDKTGKFYSGVLLVQNNEYIKCTIDYLGSDLEGGKNFYFEGYPSPSYLL